MQTKITQYYWVNSYAVALTEEGIVQFLIKVIGVVFCKKNTFILCKRSLHWTSRADDFETAK